MAFVFKIRKSVLIFLQSFYHAVSTLREQYFCFSFRLQQADTRMNMHVIDVVPVNVSMGSIYIACNRVKNTGNCSRLSRTSVDYNDCFFYLFSHSISALIFAIIKSAVVSVLRSECMVPSLPSGDPVPTGSNFKVACLFDSD